MKKRAFMARFFSKPLVVVMTPSLSAGSVNWALTGNGCTETGRSINCSGISEIPCSPANNRPLSPRYPGHLWVSISTQHASNILN